jgi:hypothetical protein
MTLPPSGPANAAGHAALGPRYGRRRQRGTGCPPGSRAVLYIVFKRKDWL